MTCTWRPPNCLMSGRDEIGSPKGARKFDKSDRDPQFVVTTADRSASVRKSLQDHRGAHTRQRTEPCGPFRSVNPAP
jgi:hypothetical protein